MFLTPKRKLLYVTDIRNDLITGVFEHLSCFFPGLLALGAHVLPANAFSSVHELKLHKAVARGIAHTCYLTYADMPSGLGADEVMMESFIEGRFDQGRWLDRVDIARQSSIPGVIPLAPPLKPVEREARDYILKTPVYLLRPEVCHSRIRRSRLTLDVHSTGRGIYVSYVENHWAGKLEATRVAHVPGHGKKHTHEDGLRFGSGC